MPALQPLQAEPLGSDIPGSRRLFDLRLLGLAGIQSWGVSGEQADAAVAVATVVAGRLEMIAVLADSTSQRGAAVAGL